MVSGVASELSARGITRPGEYGRLFETPDNTFKKVPSGSNSNPYTNFFDKINGRLNGITKYTSDSGYAQLFDDLRDGIRNPYSYGLGNKIKRFGKFLYDPKVEGKAIKELLKKPVNYLKNVRYIFYLASLSDDGTEPTSTSQKLKNICKSAYNFIKTPTGMVWVSTSIILPLLYYSFAKTFGHKPSQDLPINRKIYGIEYEPWAFPLNPDVTGEGFHAVARRVIFWGVEPDPLLIQTNLKENLKANAPFYASTSLIPSAVYGGLKGIKKAVRHAESRKR